MSKNKVGADDTRKIKVLCPKCGQSQLRGAAFCHKCGAQMEAKGPRAMAAGANGGTSKEEPKSATNDNSGGNTSGKRSREYNEIL